MRAFTASRSLRPLRPLKPFRPFGGTHTHYVHRSVSSFAAKAPQRTFSNRTRFGIGAILVGTTIYGIREIYREDFIEYCFKNHEGQIALTTAMTNNSHSEIKRILKQLAYYNKKKDHDAKLGGIDIDFNSVLKTAVRSCDLTTLRLFDEHISLDKISDLESLIIAAFHSPNVHKIALGEYLFDSFEKSISLGKNRRTMNYDHVTHELAKLSDCSKHTLFQKLAPKITQNTDLIENFATDEKSLTLMIENKCITSEKAEDCWETYLKTNPTTLNKTNMLRTFIRSNIIKGKEGDIIVQTLKYSPPGELDAWITLIGKAHIKSINIFKMINQFELLSLSVVTYLLDNGVDANKLCFYGENARFMIEKELAKRGTALEKKFFDRDPVRNEDRVNGYYKYCEAILQLLIKHKVPQIQVNAKKKTIRDCIIDEMIDRAYEISSQDGSPIVTHISQPSEILSKQPFFCKFL